MALSRWSLPLFFLMAGFFGAALLAALGHPAVHAATVCSGSGFPLRVGLVTVVPLSVLADHRGRRRSGAPAGSSEPCSTSGSSGTCCSSTRGPARGPARRGAAADAVGRAPAGARRSRRLRWRWSPSLLDARGATCLPMAGASRWLFPSRAWWRSTECFFVGRRSWCTAGRGIDALGRRPALNAALACAALVPIVLLRDGPDLARPRLLRATRLEGWLWMAAFCLPGSVGGLPSRCAASPGAVLTRDRPRLRYVADSVVLDLPQPLPAGRAGGGPARSAAAALPGRLGCCRGAGPVRAPGRAVRARRCATRPVGRVLNGRRPPRALAVVAAPDGRVPERASG